MANTSGSTANGSPYDKIIEMIQRLDLQDDGIVMNHKIKSIECDFCSIVRDEGMLNESMEYINDRALHDGNTSLKFALLFSSRNFDSLAMNETKVRSKMLKILELNYVNADVYRSTDKNRFYNSITLLGEYYHRVRLADNSPITILGQSLLALLIREISGNDIIDAKLAKLILSQVTLNGDIMRVQHKDDLTQLLFHVRRNLIEQGDLLPSTKALLLMTLDLYYSNFANLGHMLEEMYTKYLVQESEAVNGNGDGEGYENPQPKKWSELVSEDSFYETEGYYENSNVSDDCNSHSHPCEEPQAPSPQVPSPQGPSPQRSPPQRHQRHHGRQNHRDRGNNPRLNERSPPHEEEEEERQQPPEEKPLPRWRAPRFNRPDDEHSANNNGRQNRRFSGSYDDDRHSVRSDGGSIRLYSINDRLRHSQKNASNNGDGGWDRNNGGYQNFNGNSRGRGNGGGNRNFNFRNTYDRPPRFQKAEKMRNSIERDQWRNNGGGHPDDDTNSNVGDPNSRSSSRARTLPRPPKGKFDMYNGGNRSQSPNSYRQNNRPQNSRNFSRSNRYSSQSSLASESSNTWDRRHNRRNYSNRQSPHAHRNEWEDTHSVHGQPEEDNWVNKDNNSELVRNARNTAKYMNYLSQK